jgi:hypothetical protein
MTIEEIAAEALTLPGEERALLADLLVESLDTAGRNRASQQRASDVPLPTSGGPDSL